MEAGNPPETEVKTMVTRMLKALSMNFNKGIVSIKKNIEIIFLKTLRSEE